jgi:hypothetical protein
MSGVYIYIYILTHTHTREINITYIVFGITCRSVCYGFPCGNFYSVHFVLPQRTPKIIFIFFSSLILGLKKELNLTKLTHCSGSYNRNVLGHTKFYQNVSKYSETNIGYKLCT